MSKPKRVPIVCASDLPDCLDCGEKWCPKHEQHYADCPCIGPHNAEDHGLEVISINGKLFGVKAV